MHSLVVLKHKGKEKLARKWRRIIGTYKSKRTKLNHVNL